MDTYKLKEKWFKTTSSEYTFHTLTDLSIQLKT